MPYDPRYQVSGISDGLPPLPMPNDYILRSDVEKMIKKSKSFYYKKHGFQSGVGVDRDNLLYRLSSIQSVDRWIPVSERLPEPRQEVLFLSKGDIKFGYYVKSAHGDTEYWYSGGGYFPGKITHWQPLPPSPSSHEER